MDSSQKLLNNLQTFYEHVLMEERAINELYESIRNEFTKLPGDIEQVQKVCDDIAHEKRCTPLVIKTVDDCE